MPRYDFHVTKSLDGGVDKIERIELLCGDDQVASDRADLLEKTIVEDGCDRFSITVKNDQGRTIRSKRRFRLTASEGDVSAGM